MTIVDLAFRAMASEPVPADHGFALFGAVCRVLPKVHEDKAVGVHPIRGRLVGDRRMALAEYSAVTLRVPAERIAEFLPLAGAKLDLAGVGVRLGVPTVRPLIPAPMLRSRLVTINLKEQVTPESLAAALRRQLDELGIAAAAVLHLGRRRTLRLHEREIVGHQTIVAGLSADESLLLQARGLGGRRRMGCGVFAPLRGDAA